MIFFLDSSCVIREVTRDGPALIGLEQAELLVASQLSRLEVARTLNRLRLELKISGADVLATEQAFAIFARPIEWIPLGDGVLELAARPTAIHLKSLDAIQLATARIVRDAPTLGLVFATHDRRLAAAAVSFGFEVVGV